MNRNLFKLSHASRLGPGTGDGGAEDEPGPEGFSGALGIWSAADRMKSRSGKASSVVRDLQEQFSKMP